MDNLICVEITVSGHVQGVGFRYFIYEKAKLLNLKGYVKNLYDGTVFIKAEGERSQIERIIGYAQHGPSRAAVTGKKIDYYSFEGKFHEFSVI